MSFATCRISWYLSVYLLVLERVEEALAVLLQVGRELDVKDLGKQVDLLVGQVEPGGRRVGEQEGAHVVDALLELLPPRLLAPLVVERGGLDRLPEALPTRGRLAFQARRAVV